MDKITAKGLKFKGCHGVLTQEKTTPQEFIVDLGMFLDLRAAGLKDDLKLTVNYDEVFHQVENIVEKETYNLIEALAEKIAAELLARFPLQAVEVTVYKPDAPVEGDFDYFAVTIKRTR
ncbi:MAG: dihydroneopterin aldolase [Syntrophomonadaceae bacterium]|nr:dihydroneopterin aldolase [Syntrophomonadaceae bacterium]MDD3888898.1 dihydroneopterin aldolase [Syntrophomonadaceae bacterium]MDD4548930.1 dihydroneopterin aldolase [Syntrophomonadaceae bacterium]